MDTVATAEAPLYYPAHALLRADNVPESARSQQVQDGQEQKEHKGIGCVYRHWVRVQVYGD